MHSALHEPLGHSSFAGETFERFDDCWIDRPIFSRFELIAARAPEKIALDDGVLRLTYLEVLRAAKHAALRIEAIAPAGRPVGIFLPNDSLFPVAALACLAAGRVYVPIDQNYPDQRNAQIVREAGLAAVISNSADGISHLSSAAIPHLNILDSLSTSSDAAIRVAKIGGPAVVLYTSGSTGYPKGICNDQQAILQRVAQFTNTCRLGASDRFVLMSSPGTIAGVRDTFAALLNGSSLHIAEPRRLGMSGLLRTFQDHKITICYAVPALLRELLLQPSAKGACNNIRILRLGGDSVLASDIALCRSTMAPSCRILVGYGSTEVPTVFQWFVPPDWAPDGRSVPCGYAMPDIPISLVAESGDAAALGEVAEVVVSSRFVAIGTWQNGRLQREAFPVDPENTALRVVHTGDLVRLRADGLVELVGRKDRQLKIRGFRVDPSDIESALCRCDDVAEAVVIGKGVDGKDALVAYVVPRAGVHASIRKTLNNAAMGLPGHMRPARFHIIDAIPRLPSFKPDIKLLEQLGNIAATKAASLAQRRDAPETELEATILAIWQRLLKAEDFGVSDNFFEAGGDSLCAMKLILEIEAQLGIEISLETIFTSPTVRELCTHFGESCDRKPAVILPIKSGQSATTLHFIHSGSEFSALSSLLRSDISTAFVTANGTLWLRRLIGGKDIVEAIDRISDAYAQVILAKHRTGPFYLAAHSFWGIIAIEIACKLEGLGAGPGTIFLFDTYLHGSLHRVLHDIRHNGLLFLKVRQLLQGNSHDMGRRALFLTRKAFYRSAQSSIGEKTLADFDEELRVVFRDFREEASQAYRGPTRPLTSQVVLFRATRSVEGRTLKHDPNLGWARPLEENLTIIPTPGDHDSLMREGHVTHVVADEIDRRISLRDARA